MTRWRRLLPAAIGGLIACEGAGDPEGPADPAGPEPVEVVELSPSVDRLHVGGTRQLHATIREESGDVVSDREVAWASSDDMIASVSGQGLVTAVAVGKAAITATSEGKADTAEIVVRPVPVASIEVSPDTKTLHPGDTVQLTATAKDVDRKVLEGRVVEWRSSDAGVATVSESGLVTAAAVGKTTITAVSEGKADTADIVVLAVAVASVAVSPAARSLQPGDAVQLAATAKDADGKVLAGRAVQWTSSNPAVATVSDMGLVTAVAEGVAEITAEVEGKAATATITVEPTPEPTPVASVEVTPAEASLTVGQVQQFTAVAKDASGNVLTGRTISWESSSPAATVTSGGLVTAAALGMAVITATVGGEEGTATVSVIQPPPATGIQVAVTSPVEATRFFLAVDGDSFDDPEVIEVATAPTTTATFSLSVPAGGPYRVRALIPEAQADDPTSTVAATGKATDISVSAGSATKVEVNLERPSYSVSAPSSAQGGSTVTVTWTITDPGSSIEDVGYPWTGEVEYTGSSAGSSDVVAATQTSDTTYSFTATFQAPVTPGTIYVQTRTLSFGNVYAGFVDMVSHWAPSAARGEAAHAITIQ